MDLDAERRNNCQLISINTDLCTLVDLYMRLFVATSEIGDDEEHTDDISELSDMAEDRKKLKDMQTKLDKVKQQMNDKWNDAAVTNAKFDELGQRFVDERKLFWRQQDLRRKAQSEVEVLKARVRSLEESKNKLQDTATESVDLGLPTSRCFGSWIQRFVAQDKRLSLTMYKPIPNEESAMFGLQFRSLFFSSMFGLQFRSPHSCMTSSYKTLVPWKEGSKLKDETIKTARNEKSSLPSMDDNDLRRDLLQKYGGFIRGSLVTAKIRKALGNFAVELIADKASDGQQLSCSDKKRSKTQWVKIMKHFVIYLYSESLVVRQVEYVSGGRKHYLELWKWRANDQDKKELEARMTNIFGTRFEKKMMYGHWKKGISAANRHRAAKAARKSKNTHAV